MFEQGEVKLFQVGPFTVFDYLNPHGIPLVYIAVDDPYYLEKFSLPRKSSFVFRGKTYYLTDSLNKVIELSKGDSEVRKTHNAFHDVTGSLLFCSSLLIDEI